MAALSSRTVARLSQNLHRISLTRGPKVNHVYAALLHNSYTLNAGIFSSGEEEDGETFLSNFYEAHSHITKQQDLPKATIKRQQRELEEQLIKYKAAKEKRKVWEQKQQHRKHIERGLSKQSEVKEIKWYEAVLVPGYYENKKKAQLKTIIEENVYIKESASAQQTETIEREVIKDKPSHSEVSMFPDILQVDSDPIKSNLIESVLPDVHIEMQGHSNIKKDFQIVKFEDSESSDISLQSEVHIVKQDDNISSIENIKMFESEEKINLTKDSLVKPEVRTMEKPVIIKEIQISQEILSNKVIFIEENEKYFDCVTTNNNQPIEEDSPKAEVETAINAKNLEEIMECDMNISSVTQKSDEVDEFFDCVTDIPKPQLAAAEDEEQIINTSITANHEGIDIETSITLNETYPTETVKEELKELGQVVSEEEKVLSLQAINNDEAILKQIMYEEEQDIAHQIVSNKETMLDVESTVITESDSGAFTLTSDELLKLLHKTPETTPDTQEDVLSECIPPKTESEIQVPLNIPQVIRFQDLGVWNTDQRNINAISTDENEEICNQKIDIRDKTEEPRIPLEVQMIQVPEGSKDVTVGTLIAVLAPEGEDWKTIEIPKVETEAPIAAAPPPLPTAPAPSIAAVAATPAVIHTVKHGNFGISVLLLLEQYGLTPEQVTATGRNGILLKGDVLKHIKTLGLQPLPVPIVPPPTVDKPAAAAAVVAPAAPAPPSAPVAPPLTGVSEDGWVDIEVTNMRRTIAKRLSQSKGGIAHSYGTLDCCADKLLALRKYHKAEGISISVNDLIIKAVATALQHCPEMNAVWKGDQLHIASEVDISVAVATPAGLITPIVKDADALGVEEINATVKELASRARINKLKPEEFLGGTFTISNLGMFGISEFSAIINPPQCGILAVGGSRLTLSESGSPTTRMSATLSYDRAAVDDYTAAIFLETLKDLLEEPNTLLVGARSRDINHPLSALL